MSSDLKLKKTHPVRKAIFGLLALLGLVAVGTYAYQQTH